MKERLLTFHLKFDKHHRRTSAFFTKEIWEFILGEYIFKICDSFGLIGICSIQDLRPNGLELFLNWDFEYIELVEETSDIVARFKLNDSCKSNISKFDFALHKINEEYYEFDEMYFFKGARQIATYIHHESVIILYNLNSEEVVLLEGINEKKGISVT